MYFILIKTLKNALFLQPLYFESNFATSLRSSQSNGDARVVMRGSSHHSSGFSPYLSPGWNCDTRLARTHTHREDMEKEDWVA